MEGGRKKFLYTGPRRRNQNEDAEEDQWDFSGCTSSPERQDNKASDVDLDDVWSIKKNVVIPQQKAKQLQPDVDPYQLQSNRGFYSRHAGSSGEFSGSVLSSAENRQLTDQGRSWSQQKNYSYSYANRGSLTTQPTAQNGSSLCTNAGQSRHGLNMSSRHSTNGNNSHNNVRW